MKVLYAGDDKLYTNHFFAGTESVQQFQRQVRDWEPLLESLEANPDVDVEHMRATDAIEDFPETSEELAAYDALILSDFSRGTLQPHFLPDAIPGPNKVHVVRDYVQEGGGLLYCGGWMTFQGYRGIGNWQGTPVADLLPVEMLGVFDDRIERPSGAEASPVDVDHPVMDGIDWDSFPRVYGYNETAGVDDDARLHATVAGDPLIATREHGDGRVLVYTSDPGPKWGFDFYEWEGYDQFWDQSLRWAVGSE